MAQVLNSVDDRSTRPVSGAFESVGGDPVEVSLQRTAELREIGGRAIPHKLSWNETLSRSSFSFLKLRSSPAERGLARSATPIDDSDKWQPFDGDSHVVTISSNN